MPVKSILYGVIFLFIILLGFSTIHQAQHILQKMKVRGTVTEYHNVEQLPPCSIIVAGLKEFDLMVSRPRGIFKNNSQPREGLLDNCTVFEVPYMRNSELQQWLPVTPINRHNGLWTSFMSFECPRLWKNGHVLRVACTDQTYPMSYLIYVSPKNFSQFSREWNEMDDSFDYSDGVGSESGAYMNLLDHAGTVPTLLGSGTLTSIQMTRKETYLNEHLQHVEIATKVSSSVLREKRFLRLMSVAFRWSNGDILRVKNFVTESYYSLAFLFCTVGLAIERSFAILTRVRSLAAPAIKPPSG